MAINYNNVTNRIFDLLVGTDYEVLMGDDDAKKTLDPNSAVRFYVQDLHSMVFLDKSTDTLKLYISNGEDEDKVARLLDTMKKTADHYMLRFSAKNYGKKLEPKDFAYQTAVAESVKMSGTTKSSYQNFGAGKLIIRHTKSVNEEQRGARSRSIKSIYVENREGERFHFPVKWLTGARAMARHVAEGGVPHDELGSKIKGLSEEYVTLKKFIRHANVKGFVNEATQGLIDVAISKTTNIERAMRKMNFEGVNYKLAEAEDDKISELKNSFTQHITASTVESALPYLYQLVLEKESFDAGQEALHNIEHLVSTTPSFDVIGMNRNDHTNPINLDFDDNDTAIKHTAKYMMDHITHPETKEAIQNALTHYNRWSEDEKNHFNTVIRDMIRKVVKINTENTEVSVTQEALDSVLKTAMGFKIEQILSK